LAKPRPAYLLVTLAPLFWAGNFVLGRALHETIPPIALSFWRWAVALLILLPFALTSLRRQRILLRRHWSILTLLGVLGVTNFNTFVYLGLQTTSATNAVLLQSTTPVLIVGLSFLLLQQGIGLRQTAGILLSLGGVAVIVARGDLGICTPIHKVPIAQKEIIKICRLKEKPVAVATQMLESMTSSIRPTRAEVADVANAMVNEEPSALTWRAVVLEVASWKPG